MSRYFFSIFRPENQCCDKNFVRALNSYIKFCNVFFIVIVVECSDDKQRSYLALKVLIESLYC